MEHLLSAVNLTNVFLSGGAVATIIASPIVYRDFQFKINMQKLELITPLYEKVEKDVFESVSTELTSLGNLLREIEQWIQISGLSQDLPQYLKNPDILWTQRVKYPESLPHRSRMAMFKLNLTLMESLELQTEITSYYKINAYVAHFWKEQKSQITVLQRKLRLQRGEIQSCFSNDRWRLSKIARRRGFFRDLKNIIQLRKLLKQNRTSG